MVFRGGFEFPGLWEMHDLARRESARRAEQPRLRGPRQHGVRGRLVAHRELLHRRRQLLQSRAGPAERLDQRHVRVRGPEPTLCSFSSGASRSGNVSLESPPEMSPSERRLSAKKRRGMDIATTSCYLKRRK